MMIEVSLICLGQLGFVIVALFLLYARANARTYGNTNRHT